VKLFKTLCSILWITFVSVVVSACAANPEATDTLAFENQVSVANPLVAIFLDKSRIELTGGADNLVEGVVRYNKPNLVPVITENEQGIKIEQPERHHDLAPIRASRINDWELRLGNAPLKLEIESEGMNGEINLSGIAIQDLVIRERGSLYKLVISEPNPARLDKIVYQTNASQAELIGLGNSQAAEFVFEGIGGIYSLDFSGPLRQDMNVHITYGLGSLTLVIPAETNATITLLGNYRHLSGQGDWNSAGNIYTTGSDGPLLNIIVEMDLGGLAFVMK